MKRSKFSEGQIVYALRQVESGTPAADVCRQLALAVQRQSYGGYATELIITQTHRFVAAVNISGDVGELFQW